MLDRRSVEEYVSREIVYFHSKRIARLEAIELGEVLRKKNPYLFKAKNVSTAGQLVTDILDAFLSSSELYIDLVEPIGHEARRHNADFHTKRANLVNVFTAEFVRSFCQPDGAIDWPRLVQFNSGNM